MQRLHIQLLGKSEYTIRQQCQREGHTETQDKAENLRNIQVRQRSRRFLRNTFHSRLCVEEQAIAAQRHQYHPITVGWKWRTSVAIAEWLPNIVFLQEIFHKGIHRLPFKAFSCKLPPLLLVDDLTKYLIVCLNLDHVLFLAMDGSTCIRLIVFLIFYLFSPVIQKV